ncbi:MAG: hypothetical protein M1819_001033 [Sarea resinae]|nr:MAG: hypothetical protein M1819_001033 [Sarea resinae]
MLDPDQARRMMEEMAVESTTTLAFRRRDAFSEQRPANPFNKRDLPIEHLSMLPLANAFAVEAANPNRERKPPPPPTPVTFPNYNPKPCPCFESTGDDVEVHDIYKTFMKIKSPSSITDEHFRALHLQLHRDVPIEELIPSPYLPPRSWQEPPARPTSRDVSADNDGPGKRLSNGFRTPGHDVFYDRVKELYFDNGDAFRDVQRLPPLPGRPNTRSAYFRKFYNNLDLMSQYWDTTLEEYIPIPSKSSEGEELENPREAPEDDGSRMDIDEPQYKKAKFGPPFIGAENKKEGQEREPSYRYKGRRLGTGSNMPDSHREDAVRSFVETVSWAFSCQTIGPRVAPRVTVQNVFFPVRLTAHIARNPSDRSLARRGHTEGPLLGVQCRPETVFRLNGGEKVDEDAERLDLLREIGVMLLIAQERARETQPEFRPGFGKWWTTVPRWGGGTGGEGGNDAGNTDDTFPGTQGLHPKQRAAIMNSAAGPGKPATTPTAAGSGSRPGSSGPAASSSGNGRSSRRDRDRDNKRDTKTDMWKFLRPGMPLWDSRFTYLRIGKDPSDEFDTIYLISSLNTHIAILKMRIHPVLLNHITYGARTPSPPPTPPPSSPSSTSSNTGLPTPSTGPAMFGVNATSATAIPDPEQILRLLKQGGKEKYILPLQRTRWFNLFDIEDRVEALRGVWGILAYLMRPQ